MEKKRALLLCAALLTLSGCGNSVGSSGAVGPASPAPSAESAESSAEELAPIVDDAPPVITTAPVELTPAIEDELAALQAPEGGQRGPADDAVSSVGTVFTVRPCAELDEWLAGRLPSVPSYVSSGYIETCATDWAGDLPTIPGTLPNGDPLEVTAHVFYAPADRDLASLSLRQVNDQGIAHLSVYSGPSIWPQETGKDPSALNGGYVSLRLKGHQFGVQNRGDSTRVAWIDNAGEQPHNVTFYMPMRPVDAVKILLSDDVADAS